MALIKKYKCMNIGNCKDANKTIVEIPVGEKLECPTCHKDMLVEMKGGTNVKMIAGIAAVVVVLGGAGAYFGGVFDGGNKGDDSLKNDSVMMVNSAKEPATTPEAEVNDAVTDTEEQQTTSETAGKDAETNIKETPTPDATANLDWASYEGPTSGGKPHGAGGELTVKSNHSIDLKNGSALDVNPGDKIKNTKFTNGVLRQGELQRKNGERKYFNIG